jgi:hypothetical protein
MIRVNCFAARFSQDRVNTIVVRQSLRYISFDTHIPLPRSNQTAQH